MFFLTMPLLILFEHVGRKLLSSRFNLSGEEWTHWSIVFLIAASLFANYSVISFVFLHLSGILQHGEANTIVVTFRHICFILLFSILFPCLKKKEA